MSYLCHRFQLEARLVLATSCVTPLSALPLSAQRVLHLSLWRRRFPGIRTHASTMSTKTPSADRQQEMPAQPSNRLILCFDGTGNAFQGTPGDTNIVKLYNMFDRTNTSQMHYYQRMLCFGALWRFANRILQRELAPIPPKGP